MNVESLKFDDQDLVLSIAIARDVINGRTIESFGLTSNEEEMVRNAIIVIKMNDDGDNMESHLGGTREIIDNILPFLPDHKLKKEEAEI